ncbi:MAG: helix-turn-helix transcriptional regulator [Actinobacteria bacterium]|nr:helix-turn-helix transcriptional regulator [Actinomycetota bacterium]
MPRDRLTDTSYVVLGLVEICEPVTPYTLKRVAEVSVLHFWSLPHSQIYAECARLGESGHLSEKREREGRRRRVYRLTPRGRRALGAWREDPRGELLELRDLGLLKLFFGAAPGPLAGEQLGAHLRRLRSYEEIASADPGMAEGQRLALEAGIGHEREFIRFWRKVSSGAAGRAAGTPSRSRR